MGILSRQLLGVVVLSALAQVAIAQQSCDILLAHGSFVVDTSNGAFKNYSYAKQVYCSDTASTYSEAKTIGASLTAPIDGIMAGLGFNESDQGYSSFRQQLCNSNESLAYAEGWHKDSTQHADAALLDAYNRCVTESSGLTQFVTQNPGANGQKFSWTIQWRSDGKIPSVYVQRYRVDNVICEGPTGIDTSPGKKFKVNGASISLQCKRTNCSDIALTIDSRDATARPATVFLPAITVPAPPAPVHQWREVHVGWAMNSPLGGQRLQGTSLADVCEYRGATSFWHANGDGSPPIQCNDNPGKPGKIENGMATWEPFDTIYSDNTGNCDFTFRCHPEEPTPPAAPSLPAWCEAAPPAQKP